MLGCVYAAIFFSLDPEWVAWAAPLAFGGALYAPGPAPQSFRLSVPEHVIPTAYLFSLAELLALMLLAFSAEKSGLSWIKQRLHRDGGGAALRSHGKPKSVASH